MTSTITDRLSGSSSSVAVKAPVRVATTAAITLSGLLTIDGEVLEEGDRVLVKDQSSAISNGVYVAGTTAWRRAADFDGSNDVVGGTQLYVIEGSVNGSSYWRTDGLGPLLPETDDIEFTAISGTTTLESDLASTAVGKGASKLGKEGGGTVQDAIDVMYTPSAIDIAGTWEPGVVDALFGTTLITSADDPSTPQIGRYSEVINSVESVEALGVNYKIVDGGILWSTATAPTLFYSNPVIRGKFGAGFGFGACVEADVDNLGADADTLSSPTGAYCFLGASGGTKRITATFFSPGYFSASKPNYGFAAAGYTNTASFHSATDASVAFNVAGANTYGLDTRNAVSITYAVMLKNDIPISGVKADGTTVVNLAKINSSNLMELGDTGVGYIKVNQALVPGVDNSYSLGTGSLRWGQIYSGTGSISTSDPTLKDDIAPIEEGAAYSLLNALSPISYRFKVGGVEVSQVEEDGEVDQTVLVEDGFTIVKGKQVAKHRFETTRVPGKVRRDVVTERPGVRTHFGFDASEVKAGLESLGIDSGLYVHDGGIDMLRMEQFTPILWLLVKDLARRVSALEAA
jgi:hypothetical protein